MSAITARSVPGMTIENATQLTPEAIAEVWRDEGSMAGCVRRLHCSPKTIRAGLRAVGIVVDNEGLVVGPPAAPMPELRFRCPSCGRPVTINFCCGEVIAPAFQAHKATGEER